MTRLLPAAALAAVLSTASAAEEGLIFPDAADDRAVGGCLQRSGEEGTVRAACIGVVADLCLGGVEEETTVVMTACHERETRYWDGMLNDRYARLMDRLDEAQAEALREAQRAWIPMRDETCTFEAMLWDGGTGSGPAATACFARETGQRALVLDAILDALDER